MRFLVGVALIFLTIFVGLALMNVSEHDDLTVLRNSDNISTSKASKKRAKPPESNFLVLGDIRYEAPKWGKSIGLEQNGGYLRAVSQSSGNELWLLQIYKIGYDGDMEDDKFDRFITRILDAGDDRLRIESERCGIYLVDILTKEIYVEREPPCEEY